MLPLGTPATSANPPWTVGVQVVVAFSLQGELQQEDGQVLVRQGAGLALRSEAAVVPYLLREFGDSPKQELIAPIRARR